MGMIVLVYFHIHVYLIVVGMNLPVEESAKLMNMLTLIYFKLIVVVVVRGWSILFRANHFWSALSHDNKDRFGTSSITNNWSNSSSRSSPHVGTCVCVFCQDHHSWRFSASSSCTMYSKSSKPQMVWKSVSPPCSSTYLKWSVNHQTPFSPPPP